MAAIELSMIVKNGAAGLERCLRSVAGIVDRVVIGDNGSADATIEIARAYHAEILNVPWTDDFAAARNAVLSRAQCDWILVLDADEMLAPHAANALPALTRVAKTAAWNMRRLDYVTDLDVRCHGHQAIRNTTSLDEAKCYPAYFESLLTRLFRRDPRIRFEGGVHETVAYSVDRAGLLRSDCGLLIHHFGYVEDSAQVRDAKSAYYHRLGLRKLTQGGGKDACAYLETGISFLDYARDPAAAQSFLEKSAELDPNSPLVWLYLGLCSTRLGRLEEAYTQLDRSRACY